MMRFSEVFPDEQIVASLMRQLSWTHFLELLPLKEPPQREFYAEMCRVQGWSIYLRMPGTRLACSARLSTDICPDGHRLVLAVK